MSEMYTPNSSLGSVVSVSSEHLEHLLRTIDVRTKVAGGIRQVLDSDTDTSSQEGDSSQHIMESAEEYMMRPQEQATPTLRDDGVIDLTEDDEASKSKFLVVANTQEGCGAWGSALRYSSSFAASSSAVQPEPKPIQIVDISSSSGSEDSSWLIKAQASRRNRYVYMVCKWCIRLCQGSTAVERRAMSIRRSVADLGLRACLSAGWAGGVRLSWIARAAVRPTAAEMRAGTTPERVRQLLSRVRRRRAKKRRARRNTAAMSIVEKAIQMMNQSRGMRMVGAAAVRM
jgi:hypothetical protein